jgi:type I restriction-modification system DNA methylase subunit
MVCRHKNGGTIQVIHDEADHLLQLPEGLSVGNEINLAMRAIEKENPDLADVLPKTYHILDSRTLAELLKVMASIPMWRAPRKLNRLL